MGRGIQVCIPRPTSCEPRDTTLYPRGGKPLRGVSGSGKYDMAQDGVDLVELYEESKSAIRGLHPFSDEEMTTLQSNSEWLLERLTPDGARAEPKKKSAEELQRDRYWTLMVRRHPFLRKIGYYLHGDDLDLHVPKLQSRVAQAVLEEEAGEETPPKPEGGP